MHNTSSVIDAVLNHWQTIVSYLMASGAVAVLVQFLKKHYKLDQQVRVWQIKSEKFVVILLGVISVVFSFADTILSSGFTTNLATYVPQLKTVAPYIFILATLIHRFALSDGWKKLDKFLVQVNQYNNSKTSVPVQAAPVQSPQPKFEG